ncbi:acyl-CoA desaturase 1-like [Oscarella lobularis]|uniref:acyl-CoA desaturase 1-like n=1 Tax=Oscarella lobularis TaxID=121494 RepID=UPI00331408C5
MADVSKSKLPPPSNEPFKASIVWSNVIIFIFLHTGALYGLLIVGELQLYSFLFAMVYAFLGGLGTTAGAHRLWTHRSYRATKPLRFALMIFNSIAMQNSIYVWARDHRVHHKHTETSADPHNSRRGFFFAHMGWLLLKKHPDVAKYGKEIDLSDLENDRIVMLQNRHYVKFGLFFSLILPTVLPVALLGESAWNAYFSVGMLRYAFSLHSTWLVNSAAHMWGMRPYDVNINPRENYLVSWLAIGEGFHNYHHSFPYDYRTSEFGPSPLNITTCFIDICVWLGLASHCRRPTQEMIRRKKEKTGPPA